MAILYSNGEKMIEFNLLISLGVPPVATYLVL